MPEYHVSGHYPFAIEADDEVSAVDRANDKGGWEWEASPWDEFVQRPERPVMLTEAQVFDDWEEVEWIEEAGDYLTGDFESLVEAMAERMHELDERFYFHWVGVLEHGVDGAMVELYLGDTVYLRRYVELKHLTDDREATGRAQALAIVSALSYEHGVLIQFVNKHAIRRA